VIGDSDEEEEAAQETAAHYESDVTIRVDDQFLAEDKIGGARYLLASASNPKIRTLKQTNKRLRIGFLPASTQSLKLSTVMCLKTFLFPKPSRKDEA